MLFLISFAIMAQTFYGENLEEYSDLLVCIIQLVKMMFTSFDYASFADYSAMTPLFFVPFMIIL